jgi:hypothetical protein
MAIQEKTHTEIIQGLRQPIPLPFPDVMRHETRLWGTLNGVEFELLGGGVGEPFRGKIKTELRSTTGPVPVPMAVLDLEPIMGYPTFSNYQKGCFDLFKISDGYDYERHIRFEDGGRMESVHHVERHGDVMTGDFRVEGELNPPELGEIEPIMETFFPSGPGTIGSRFLAAWHRPDGGIYTASVESEYRLRHNAMLPWLQFRQIQFKTDHTQEVLRQSEDLTVVRDLAALNV